MSSHGNYKELKTIKHPIQISYVTVLQVRNAKKKKKKRYKTVHSMTGDMRD